MGGGLGAQSAAASAKRDPPGKQSEPESTKQNWEGGGAPCRGSGGGRVPRADLLPGALWTRRRAVGREGGAFRDMCPGHCGSGWLGVRRYLSFVTGALG